MTRIGFLKNALPCLLLTALLLSGCKGHPVHATEPTAVTISHLYDSQIDANISLDLQLSLEDRRKLVVAEMREMMTLLWTPDADITYYVTGLEAEPVAVNLKKGLVYQGMPYTNGHASRYSFLSYAAEETNGVYTLSGLTSEALSGTGVPRIGNSCSSALSWAWGRVSSSISFHSTIDMTPFFGCLPVGSYTAPDYKFSSEKSVDICQENGEQIMYESYAQMLPGDGLVARFGAGGHAIMAAEVNVVYRDDGSVDENASTVTVIDQSQTQELSPLEEQVPGVGTVIVLQKLDQVRSFSWLYQSGYLPITCKELIDPSTLTPAAVTDYTNVPSAENMFQGRIQATHHIASVTVSILGKQGNIVQKCTCYGTRDEMTEFNLHRFTWKTEAPARQGSIDLSILAAGTYRCVFTCRVSTGENLTFRDFTFEIP